MALIFFLGGFGWLDRYFSASISSYILFVLVFFGILALASDILTTPFALYSTFVIEERYGFNRTTIKTLSWINSRAGCWERLSGADYWH